ncbi:DNA invertase [Corynebacterium sp. LK10]|uniref:recombinase family protein n=1 Tax=Corynebacterium sp. LK10 TaxID=2022656 RepID=UPI0011CBDAFC|nr:recombinase family protein [Corynebacterium sp. LK10]TXS85102.1 DNA invertase [Corynebacterium sp. LK10]
METGASKTDVSGGVGEVAVSAGTAPPKSPTKKIGYARVSTSDQIVDLQVDALRAAGCGEIVTETGSGYATGARPLRDHLLSELQQGDTLVIWRLDRLGRSMAEVLQIVDDLNSRGVNLISLTDGVDATTPTGRLLLGVLVAAAEYERNLISERTIAGLRAAKSRGRRLGRPRALTPRGLDAVLLMTQSGRTREEIADALGVGTSTVDRARRKLREEGRLS